MKILMLTRVVPPHGPGGMAAAAWDLARALRQAGAEIEVLTTSGAGSADDIPVHAVAAPPGRYSNAWWRGSRRAYARLPGRAPDVVLGVSAAAHALAAIRSPDGPAFVFQAHGASVGEIASKLRSGQPRQVLGAGRNLAWGIAGDWLYRRYDTVVAVGEAVRATLQRWPTSALVGGAPVHLIRNGVDETAFRFSPEGRAALRARLGVARETTLALFAARLQPDKGAAQAVEAVRRAGLKGADVRLVILGDGPEAERLRLRAEAQPAGRVMLPGGRPRAEMADWLSAADVLLFPTRRAEGLPLVVLEALAAGLPVLTTALGAADPELPCTRLGLHDLDAFADALGRIEPAWSARASRLPTLFSLEQSAQAYLALFERLCGRTARRAA